MFAYIKRCNFAVLKFYTDGKIKKQSGIGLATAEEFIQEGATVIITGRNQQRIDAVTAMLGSNCHGIVCDHGNLAHIFQLATAIGDITPQLDIVFANAGYGKFAPVDAVNEELFNELFNVLAKGTFFTVQQALPMMKPGSTIIFNTSVVTGYGSQNASIYSAAKAAVQSFSKTFAAELISRNIRVNAVSPGYTATDGFNKTGMSAEQIAGAKAYITTQLPYKRFAEAAEVAKAVTFLASGDSSYVHGAEIVIDGGYATIR
ncbi:SDR family oxidoreductase [Niabella sp.]|uniref:SDR family oxidoreductase n=1 Tax=Niabella sp. TaxID=1962976 RepID=UPI0026295EEF|nr:SDR family oxidoreductase [Niabella sp.]